MQAIRPDIKTSQDSDSAEQSAPAGKLRIKSEDLFRQGREVEIEHAGRIYRMRLTNQNKLILTA